MEKIIQRPRYYILVGDNSSWKVALEHKQWGFTEKSIGLWNTIKEEEFVAFYVTKPIQKIVGFAKITDKFISNEIIWPDEKFFEKPMWANRIKFEILYTVKNWNEGVKPPPNIMLNVGRKVIEKKTFELLVADAKKKWNITSKK